MILVIDNYDSFTYNLVQYLGELGGDLRVVRNDELSLDNLVQIRPSKVLISPGPGRPESAGVSLDLIKALGSSIPILGVCLGHQAIGMAYGGLICRAKTPMHGKTSTIVHDGKGIFQGLQNPFKAGRYHSLVLSPDEVPSALEVSATTKDGKTIMAVRHKTYPVHGAQFHPESILTADGKRILQNFLEM